VNRTQRIEEVLRLEGLAAAAKIRASFYREELAAEARDEYKQQGTAPSWRVPDVASVSLPLSQESPEIRDEHLFLKWCKERYPDQVETVEQVKGAFRQRLLVDAIVSGEQVIDAATGEPVPGAGVRPGGVPKSLSITPSHAARAVYAALGEQILEEMAQQQALVGGSDV
jgi:hypothetical protein